MNIFDYAPVVAVKPLAGYVLRLWFKDGTQRDVDLEPHLYGPIFEPLRDLELFRQVRVEYGTIVWPNGADIAPETLYHDVWPERALGEEA